LIFVTQSRTASFNSQSTNSLSPARYVCRIVGAGAFSIPRNGASRLARRLRQVHRRGDREVGQRDPGGSHQSGVGAIRCRLCCGAQAMSGAGHQETPNHVSDGGSFRRKPPWRAHSQDRVCAIASSKWEDSDENSPATISASGRGCCRDHDPCAFGHATRSPSTNTKQS
jgi:hypothetical protein